MEEHTGMNTRDIKFRVWDEKYKCWERASVYDMFPVTPLIKQGRIFCQFTGYKDKNNKDIYEGDILKVYNLDCAVEVEYIPTSFGFFKWGGTEYNGVFEVLDDYCPPDGYDVIGNIYENPDLLCKPI